MHKLLVKSNRQNKDYSAIVKEKNCFPAKNFCDGEKKIVFQLKIKCRCDSMRKHTIKSNCAVSLKLHGTTFKFITYIQNPQ